MASTTLANIERIVRRHLGLNTGQDSEWAQDELVDLMNLAFKDLWRDILDTGEDFFVVLDATNVTQAASATTITGLPSDVHRIINVEPRDLTTVPGLKYEPRAYGHPDFVTARAVVAAAPIARTHYFSEGATAAPVGAPVLFVAPKVTGGVLLSLLYVQALTAKVSTDTNPIPGEADQAVIAFTMAHALAKRNAGRPDDKWLGAFEVEKARLIASLLGRKRQFGFERREQPLKQQPANG